MFSSRFNELEEAVKTCVYSQQEKEILEDEALYLAFKMIEKTNLNRGIVYVIGNGGSAGIASHFSNDLMKALKIASQTLFDPNILTCLANDIGYENGFSYMLERLISSKDLLVAISSSGKSPNILNAVSIAKDLDIPTITLSGFAQENPLRKMGNLNFWIDRFDYGLVETAHFFLLHTIVDLWKKEKPLGSSNVRINNPVYAKQN